MARKSCLNRGQPHDGVVAALPGIWDELPFSYRCATHADVEAHIEGCKKDATAANLKLLRKYLASWDEVDDQGKELPLTEENIALLHHKVQGEMAGHIQGYVSSGKAATLEKNSATA